MRLRFVSLAVSMTLGVAGAGCDHGPGERQGIGPEAGDDLACTEYSNQRDATVAALAAQGVVRPDALPQLDDSLNGSFVDPERYLPAHGLEVATSSPAPLAPHWLPAELIGRPVEVYLVEYPGYSAPSGLDLVWPTDDEPAELPGQVRLNLSMSSPSGEPAEGEDVGLTTVHGAPLSMSVSIPHATLSWQDADGRGFTLQTSADEHIVNCFELLAVARSIAPID